MKLWMKHKLCHLLYVCVGCGQLGKKDYFFTYFDWNAAIIAIFTRELARRGSRFRNLLSVKISSSSSFLKKIVLSGKISSQIVKIVLQWIFQLKITLAKVKLGWSETFLQNYTCKSKITPQFSTQFNHNWKK